MAHIHGVYDTDKHFVINKATRQIKNETGQKIKLIQGDHNSECFSFVLDRFIDGHDMTKCSAVEIHYINVDASDKDNQSKGVYKVSDLQINKNDSAKAIFSWLVSENATIYAGTLSFLVKFKCDTAGVVDYKWHTDISNEVVVSNGMDNAETVTVPYPDILAQWRDEIFGNAENAVANINLAKENAILEVQEAGNNIANAVAISEDGMKNLFGNAIKAESSGESVKVDDVSSIVHQVPITVHGKNLLNINAIEIMPQNYTVRVSEVNPLNNSITIYTAPSHTGNGYCAITNSDGSRPLILQDLCPSLKAGKRYVLSGKTQNDLPFIYLRDFSLAWIFGKALTITEEYLKSSIAMYGLNSASGQGTGNCVLSDIQIEEGETATEYVPYIDPSTVTVRRYGKNLWHTENVSYPLKQLGLTVDYDAEMNIYAISGTSTSASNLYVVPSDTLDLHIKKGETWCLTAYILGGSSKDADGNTDTSVHIAPIVAAKDYSVIFPAKTARMTFEEDTVITKMYFYIYKENIVFSNLKMRIQLERDNSTAFEKFKGEVINTPSSDGTVSGIASVSPSMTILTNTEGVLIDCEYIVDTKTYIDKKIAETLKGSE